jgi:hypothetical protein
MRRADGRVPKIEADPLVRPAFCENLFRRACVTDISDGDRGDIDDTLLVHVSVVFLRELRIDTL